MNFFIIKKKIDARVWHQHSLLESIKSKKGWPDPTLLLIIVYLKIKTGYTSPREKFCIPEVAIKKLIIKGNNNYSTADRFNILPTFRGTDTVSLEQKIC